MRPYPVLKRGDGWGAEGGRVTSIFLAPEEPGGEPEETRFAGPTDLPRVRAVVCRMPCGCCFKTYEVEGGELTWSRLH